VHICIAEALAGTLSGGCQACRRSHSAARLGERTARADILFGDGRAGQRIILSPPAARPGIGGNGGHHA
jgi:hypothetical protein